MNDIIPITANKINYRHLLVLLNSNSLMDNRKLHCINKMLIPVSPVSYVTKETLDCVPLFHFA